jgi:hypothetical protein
MMKKYFLPVLISFFIILSCKEDDTPIHVPQPGATLNIPVGGPTEPNQVWVDLDQSNVNVNQRDSWDFGFYCGENFRVILNNSTYMAAGKLNSTNVDEVKESDIAFLKSVVTVGNFQADNIQYVDDIMGNYLERTAIDEISKKDEDNHVYLVNMGYSVFNGDTNELRVIGDHRGWKKIRILRYDSNSYKIQYADISDTTHKEMIVKKNTDYHFSYVSLSDGMVKVQPPKKFWDMCFTVFINENKGHGTYTFSDFVTINTMNHTGAYQANISEVGSYDDFTKEKVDFTKFVYNDHRVIGSSWRTTYGGAKVYTDRFYVLKDSKGNLFKLKFLNMTNKNGHRGYPKFEYKILID